MPYDPVKGFTPVAEVVLGTMALTVNASLPPTSTQEFIDYVKARPAQINYGSSGVGTPHHLAMEFFKRVAGLNLMHVPFRDNAGATSRSAGRARQRDLPAARSSPSRFRRTTSGFSP